MPKQISVEISTKRTAQYFRGHLSKGIDPISGKAIWFVSCESYAGGYRINSPLNVLDFKLKSLTDIIHRLKRFATTNRYQIKFKKSVL
jgi:hypothetical protein